MAIVAELSYDDIANGTSPATSHAKSWQQATLRAAEQMHQATPKIGSPGLWIWCSPTPSVVNTDDTATVKSGSRTYDIYRMKFYCNGKVYRKSTKSERKSNAQRLLSRYLGEVAAGTFKGFREETIAMQELFDDFERDCKRRHLKAGHNIGTVQQRR